MCNPRTERGTNAPPSASELRACSPFLSRTLDVVQPQIIATLGSKALAALHLICPHIVTRFATHAAAAVQWNGLTLFPLYHPSPQVVDQPDGAQLMPLRKPITPRCGALLEEHVV